MTVSAGKVYDPGNQLMVCLQLMTRVHCPARLNDISAPVYNNHSNEIPCKVFPHENMESVTDPCRVAPDIADLLHSKERHR